MFGHRELTHSGKLEGDWVDFPASPDPDPWARLTGANRLPVVVARGGHGDAKRLRGAAVTAVAVTLKGLLVTTAAVATIAYLLLTNSHI